jgi:cobalt/nickel transport system permease protein
MKHDFLDKYSDGESFIHRLDPRTKLFLSLLLITAIVLTPADSWPAYGLFLAVILVWLGLSHLPPGYVFKRSLVIMPFVLLIAVFVPFFKEGDVAAVINLGSWQITLSDNGLEVFRNVLVRAWLSIITLVILAATTSVSSLLKAMERLKMPSVMVMLLSFMYRYIFVLTDEVLRMKQARDSRNFGGSNLWQIKTAGRMIGTLFVRSYERGERVYAAMAARGFDGHGRGLKSLSFNRTDGLFGLSVAAMVVLSLSIAVL